MDEETKTALTDNELFTKLKQDMQEVLTLTRKVRLAKGPLATSQIAHEAQEKIDSVRSELYFLEEAIAAVSDKAMTEFLS